jgi:hypothetical protein
VSLSATITSAAVVLAGLTSPASFTVSGGTVSVNGGSYVSSGTADNGDSIRARLTSSGSTSTAVSCTVTIGGVSDTFTATTGDGTQAVLQISDITELGSYRFKQQLGAAGTGRLTDTGPGCFWPNEDGTVSYFFQGQNYDGYATRYPLVEMLIDPSVSPVPGEITWSTPQMTYVRDWGEFRTGHIISGSGGESNYLNGNLHMEAYPGDSTKRRLWWSISNGYVATVDHPTLSCSILNMTTHTVESIHGPWRGDTPRRRMIDHQIIALPPDFVAEHCPGYSKAMIGTMGSGLLEAPFGPELVAIQDFDPLTLPPSTGISQPADFLTKTLIDHDSDHRKTTDTVFKVCRWNGNGTLPGTYNCSYGTSLADPSGYWGGTIPGDPVDGMEETDTQAAVCWVNLPTVRGVIFYCRMVDQRPGETTIPHRGYGKTSHVTDASGGAETSPSPPYFDRACCHLQYDPEWGSTGPWAHQRRAKVIIYDGQDFANSVALGGAVQPYNHTPTTDITEMADFYPLADRPLPTSASDPNSSFYFQGSAWVDERDGRMYVVCASDRVTDADGALLPHIAVFQLPV